MDASIYPKRSRTAAPSDRRPFHIRDLFQPWPLHCRLWFFARVCKDHSPATALIGEPLRPDLGLRRALSRTGTVYGELMGCGPLPPEEPFIMRCVPWLRLKRLTVQAHGHGSTVLSSVSVMSSQSVPNSGFCPDGKDIRFSKICRMRLFRLGQSTWNRLTDYTDSRDSVWSTIQSLARVKARREA